MLNDILKDARIRMEKAIIALKSELSKIRTGRASPSLLEHLKADYYHVETPINQLASITVSDSRTLTISVWDKSAISAIEKAILNANLGLNPVTAGMIIRVPMPPLTEERRKELVKVVKAEVENTRVAVRNIRRDANNGVKELTKAKEISEDDEKKAQIKVQNLTDEFIAEIDKIFAEKEQDLMAV